MSKDDPLTLSLKLKCPVKKKAATTTKNLGECVQINFTSFKNEKKKISNPFLPFGLLALIKNMVAF